MEQQKTDISCFKSDKLLWILTALLFFIGMFANYYFSNIAWALRFSGWIILICILVFLISSTVHGKKLIAFAKDARIELYKVVWPSRDETVKTTMVVAALVLLMSLITWAFDSIFVKLIGWLMGKL